MNNYPFVGTGETEYLRGYGPQGSRMVDPRNAHAQTQAQPQGHWDGDGVSGTPMIRLVRSEQRAYFYKGDQLVGSTPVSTGSEAHVTPKGNYKVTERDIDHKSSVYGVFRDRASDVIINDDVDIRVDRTPPGAYFDPAPMPFFLRFNGGIGMHQGHLPGYPASHGCVRLPEAMARKFFENAPLGTKVVVE